MVDEGTLGRLVIINKTSIFEIHISVGVMVDLFGFVGLYVQGVDLSFWGCV